MAMARLIVFRGVFNELATANKPHPLNLYFGNGRFLRNVRSARFSSSTLGNERTEQGQEQSREERIRREKRLVGLVIGSSVGLIGSLYFLFRRLTHAKADSKTPSIDLMSENSMVENQEEGNEETDAKRKTHKRGFRERRVRKYYELVNSKTAHVPPPRANPRAFDFFEKFWSNSPLCCQFRRSNALPVRASKRVKSPTLQACEANCGNKFCKIFSRYEFLVQLVFTPHFKQRHIPR